MQDRRTQRERQIYESVLRLWQEKGDLHTITVQQVADAAGLGKGTMYEYFSSREEIFAKAFLYRMETEFLRLETNLERAENVDERLRELLNMADRVLDAQAAGLQILSLGVGEKQNLEQLCTQAGCKCSERIEKLLENTVKQGIAEGVFAPPQSMRYALLALRSALAGYVSYRRAHPKEMGVEQDTIALLRRALG